MTLEAPSTIEGFILEYRRKLFAVELLDVQAEPVTIEVMWKHKNQQSGDRYYCVAQVALRLSDDEGRWVASPRFPLVFGPTVQTVTPNHIALVHIDRLFTRWS